MDRIDRLDSGKNLSIQIAKQTKELKRLREIEKTHESTSQKLVEATEELKRRDELEGQLSGLFLLSLSTTCFLFV